MYYKKYRNVVRKIRRIYLKVRDIPMGIKATVIYTLATLLTKGVNFFTMPIFTKFLTTSEMGIISIYNSWYSLFLPIVTLGVTTGSFSVAMNQYKKNRFEYMSSAISLSSVSIFFYFIVYILFFDNINNFLELPSSLILLMFLGFLVTPAYNMYLAKERFEYGYKKVSLLTTFTVLTSTLVSLFSVLYYKSDSSVNLGIVRLLSGNIIMYIIAIPILIYIVINGRTFISQQTVKFTLNNSFPLIIHSFARSLLDTSDRLMISKFVGNSAVGIYGIVYSISSISLVFWDAINSSLIPYMFTKIDQNNKEEVQLNKIVESILVFYAVISIVITSFAPELISILATEEYYDAIYLVPPIAAGIYFTALYNIFANVLLFYKKSSYIMYMTIISAICNLILNWIFIPRYGYVAAAYTTLITYVLLALMQFKAMEKSRKGKKLFNGKNLTMISIFTTIIILLINLLYLNTIVRYLVMFIIIGIMIMNRNSFINIIDLLKRK